MTGKRSEMKSKTEILEELRLDRSRPDEPRFGVVRYLVVSILLLIFAAIVVFVVKAMPWADESRTAGAERTTPVAVLADAEQRPEIRSGGETRTAMVTAPVNPADDAAVLLDASGYITARRIATVSAKTIGLITDVLVEEGMRVEQGQVLARLDPSLAELDLRLSEAGMERLQSEIARAKLELDEAIRVYERQQKLQDNRFTNEAELSRVKTTVETLRASIKTLELDYKIAGLQVARQKRSIEDYTIKAPFTGVVSVKNAQPGEIISPSSAGGGFTRTGICTIVDMDSLEIEVDINESFIRLISEGQPVEAELYAYEGWSFSGRVSKIIPAADRAKATIRVRIQILDKDERILPDMAVKVSFLKS